MREIEVVLDIWFKVALGNGVMTVEAVRQCAKKQSVETTSTYVTE